MEDGFAYIPACMLKLSPELYHLWGAIRSTMKGGPHVSIQTLCELTGKSERQVFRNLALLARCGAIRIESKPGQRRKIFCTPETFRLDELDDSLEHKVKDSKAKLTDAKETDVHDTVTCDTDVHDSVTDDRGGMSPMTVAPVMHVSSKEENNINHPENNNTPLTPQESRKEQKGGWKVSPIGISGPIVRSATLDFYKILGQFRKAAGAKLAVGDLLPSSAPPPDFSGVLPSSLERQWCEFLQKYNEPLGLSQEELEERFTNLGKYFALGKNYWLKDGKIIALRWFCNPIHRNRAYEIIDEAVAWSCKTAPPAQPKPNAPPTAPTPEEERLALEGLEHMPRSSKEILSRMLSTFLPRETENPIEPITTAKNAQGLFTDCHAKESCAKVAV